VPPVPPKVFKVRSLVCFGQTSCEVLLLKNARDQYQQPDYGKCWCNEFEVAEKVLDLSVVQTSKNRLFDDLDDCFADNSCKYCRQDEESSKLVEGSETLEICAAPLRQK
jgi:hypothetical protein